MADALTPTLKNELFKNWLKGALAVGFAKEGLVNFVGLEITDFQRYVFQIVYTQKGIASGTTCNLCTTANLLACPTPGFCSKGKRCKVHNSNVPDKKPNQTCPKGLCNDVRDVIRQEHRFNGPSWKNTDASQWCSDAFEISKCFLPPDGYSDKTSLADTDFNGILAIITNNKRFQSKISDNLGKEPNICTQARLVGRAIRHSANHLLSDKDLTKCIDDLISLLSDPAFLAADAKATDAVWKLNQLKINTLTIHANDITKVLTENIVETFSDQQERLMQTIQEYFNKHETATAEAINNMVETAIQDIKARSSQSEFSCLSQHSHEKDLKRDLITHYREHESTIPVSPLVEHHNVPLEEFYVQPPMSAFDKPHVLSRGNKDFEDSNIYIQNETSSRFPGMDPVSSYRELFFYKKNTPYKHIYISAQAGSGKTSFSKQLAVKWCQAMSSGELREFEDDDLTVLKSFEFLFLLHLRDFQSTQLCNVEDMIWAMITSTLPGSDKYSEHIMNNILREKRCLIVLDGLDEWNHPEKKCLGKEQIPHLKPYQMCTTLTTSRPWKISTVGLASNQIDRHVELMNLDNKTLRELGSKALNILNKNKTLTPAERRELSQFLEKIKSTKSEEIITIPYVLLQLICLWHDGRELGQSKCEIYSNITDFMLERGLKRTDFPELLYSESSTYILPKCIINTDVCRRHIHLLLKLGKLAFFSLFNENKESTLIIDHDTVLKYLDEKELYSCLKIGLLSQSKDQRFVSKEKFKVYFNHKSIQEFYAALYISYNWQNEETKEIILNACKDISDILEISGVIVFICGINCDVYSSLSLELQNFLENEKLLLHYRQRLFSGEDIISRTKEYTSVSSALIAYQSMQVSCLQEYKRNHNNQVTIPLYDIFLDLRKVKHNDWLELGELSKWNCNNMKSLFLRGGWYVWVMEVIKQIMKGSTPLELLYWINEVLDNDIFPGILAVSAKTLKYIHVTLFNEQIPKSFTDSITDMKYLQGISLWTDRFMPTSDIERYFVYFVNTKTLTKIYFHCDWITDDMKGRRLSLDLSNLTKLQSLRLPDSYDLSELHVNTDCLEECELNANRFSADVLKMFFAELQGAPVLSELTLNGVNHVPDLLVKTIPTLLQLKVLSLCNVDLVLSGLFLPETMTKFEYLYLKLIEMYNTEWTELFESIDKLSQSVTVRFQDIDFGDRKLMVKKDIIETFIK